MFCIVLYEIKIENKKNFFFFFFFQIGNFLSGIGKKHTFCHWEWGRISAPKSGDQQLWQATADRASTSLVGVYPLLMRSMPPTAVILKY